MIMFQEGKISQAGKNRKAPSEVYTKKLKEFKFYLDKMNKFKRKAAETKKEMEELEKEMGYKP